MGDIERLFSKVAIKTIQPRDLIAIKNGLNEAPGIHRELKPLQSPLIHEIAKHFDSLQDIRTIIEAAIVDDPPLSTGEGGYIKQGYSKELDHLIHAVTHGKSWIINYEASQRELTNIPSLKVRYNRVFGYYIEVTKTHLKSVPPSYQRKQTITGGERYITDELKTHEEEMFNATERRLALEESLYAELIQELSFHQKRFQQFSQDIATIDFLSSLASAARENGYVRPEISDRDFEIRIEEGRHPVLEHLIPSTFIPNSVTMGQENNRFILLTGPNMAGKTTVMRQVALITIMAQMGSFVPAKRCYIGIVDKIFTRVGASDNILEGSSTFMVEMKESASILKNATHRSLILMDEVGRGTSTHDGMSIAWAIAEYIHNHVRARTIFSTHYHELTHLADTLPCIQNFHVAVREWNDEIIFIRKLLKGASSKSYGIHVARLAGLPPEIITRAKELMRQFESHKVELPSKDSLQNPNPQMSLF